MIIIQRILVAINLFLGGANLLAYYEFQRDSNFLVAAINFVAAYLVSQATWEVKK